MTKLFDWDNADVAWEPRDSYVLRVPMLLEDRAVYFLRDELYRVRDEIDGGDEALELDWDLTPARRSGVSGSLVAGELVLRSPQLLSDVPAHRLRPALDGLAADAQQAAESSEQRDTAETEVFLARLRNPKW